MNPCKPVAFMFCDRKRTSIKILVYDKNGFVLAQKKLLKGNDGKQYKFNWPRNSNEMKQITKKQLDWILTGLSLEPKGYLEDIDITKKRVAF